VKFEIGDYVTFTVAKNPEFVWQVESIVHREELSATTAGPITTDGDKLTLKPVCTLEGKPVSDPDIKQRAWSFDVEQAPAMLVIAWESQ
jgi:hypothetical protein